MFERVLSSGDCNVTITDVKGATISDLGTEGGEEIMVHGMNFGTPPLYTSYDCEDGSTRPSLVYGLVDKEGNESSRVRFGSDSQIEASCCNVLSSELIQCLSGPGVGRGHTFQLTLVDGYGNERRSNNFTTKSGQFDMGCT